MVVKISKQYEVKTIKVNELMTDLGLIIRSKLLSALQLISLPKVERRGELIHGGEKAFPIYRF